MGFAEDYAQEKEEQRRKVQLQVARHADIDPGRAARVYGVAAKTNLPNNVVDTDLENLEKRLKANTYSYDDYTDENSGSPVFNKFATENPYNYAVLDRDRKNMTGIERAAHMMDLGWDAGWGTTEMADIIDRQMKGDEREGDGARLEHLEELVAGGDFGADSGLLKSLVWTANQLPIQTWIVKESADEIVGMALAYGAGAAAASLVGPQAVVSPITIPGAMTAGARHGFLVGRTRAAFQLERALAYGEYRKLGLDDSDARIAANMVGVVNAAAESIGIGALTKRLPGFNKIQKDRTGAFIGQIFKQPTFKQGLARATMMYGEGMATEIATEIVQESMTIAGGEYLKSQARAAGDNRDELRAMTGEEYWRSVKQIAVQTMYGTSIIGSAGPIWQLRADAKRARAAREQGEMWSALGEAAGESETRESAPEVWNEFVKRIQENGGLKEIRIKADGWRSYWQSKKIDPDVAAKELGLDLEEIEASDVDVVVPFDAFVDKIASTEHLEGLKPHLRIREGEFTAREAEDWAKSKDVHIAEVEKVLAQEFPETKAENIAARDQIAESMTDELVNAGYVPEAAATMAKVHSSVMTVTAMRAGMDPIELNNQRLAGVQKEVPESLAGKDVNMDVDPLLDTIRAKRFPKQREIRGASLMDLMRDKGVQDEGAELSSRDLGTQYPGVISKEGRSLDGLAEVAFEGGYIDSYDQTLLLEAIDRELSGEQVFSRTAEINTELNDLLNLLEQSSAYLEESGIDIENMTNAEVRKAIEGVKTLSQSSTEDLKGLYELLGKAIERDPALMGEAAKAMPRITKDQNFASIEYQIPFIDSKGKTGTATINAQEAHDDAVSKRNRLNRLLDCVNG